jgi:D-proline reductase (dithiol) PrdB
VQAWPGQTPRKALCLRSFVFALKGAPRHIFASNAVAECKQTMVRLSDLTPEDAQHLLDKACAPFATAPFVAGPPLCERRVAIVTTAGLHRRDDPNFDLSDLSYRVIPGDVCMDDLLMTQASVNFDRSGFQQDVNVVFPLARLRELEQCGEIGSVADFHYAFNGAGHLPQAFEPSAREVGQMLKEDGVNAALLVPV